MIVLFTDFGLAGPYQGQMKAVLHRQAPKVWVVDLFADAPAADPRASAYLLAAYDQGFAFGTVFLCVVDPGVGTARRAVAVRADDRWYVGPDNGLFHAVIGQAEHVEAWEIRWRPKRMSASFHGRDLFAPVAADLARGHWPDGVESVPVPPLRRPWPDDLAEIIYVDHFGNAVTGMRAAALDRDALLLAGEQRLASARTFAERPPGDAFWYENANGLVEIAVNQGHAAEQLALRVGDPIRVSPPA